MKKLDQIKRRIEILKIKSSFDIEELSNNLDYYVKKHDQKIITDEKINEKILKIASKSDDESIYNFLEIHSLYLLDETREKLIQKLLLSNNILLLSSCLNNVKGLSKKNVDELIDKMTTYKDSSDAIFYLRDSLRKYFEYGTKEDWNNISGKSAYKIMKLFHNYKDICREKDVENLCIHLRRLNSQELGYIIDKYKNENDISLEFIYYLAVYADNSSYELANCLVEIFLENNKPEYAVSFVIKNIAKISKNNVYAVLEKAMEKNFNVRFDFDSLEDFTSKNVNRLNKKEINKLLKKVIEENDTAKSVMMALYVNHEKIDKKNMDKIISLVIDNIEEVLGNPYECLSNLIQKTNDDYEDALINKSVNMANGGYYQDAYLLSTYDVEDMLVDNDLSLANIKKLIEVMVENYDVYECVAFLDFFSDDRGLLESIKKIIFNSKNKILIAGYLFILNDIKLINKIYGNIYTFINYIEKNKDELDIDDKEIDIFKNNYVNINKYVDNNLDLYLKESNVYSKNKK